MFFWPLEMMMRFQANVASTFQETAAAWAQRRQEAAENAVKTLDRLVHSRDIVEVLTVQQQWFESSIRRFEEDLSAIATKSTNISQRAAATTSEALSQSVEAIHEAVHDGTQQTADPNSRAEEPNGERSHEMRRGKKHSKARGHHKRAG
jgi:hypothetical protein